MPAIIKARRPAATMSTSRVLPGIAFRTDSGNKYNNVARIAPSVPASSSLAYQTKKPERHWTLLQEQSYLFFVAGKKHQAIRNLGVDEPPIHPTHQPNRRWVICFAPNRIRTLWPAWPCTVLALFKMLLQCKAFQWAPVKGSTGKKWKDLARWFKSPIPTDPGLK